MRKRWGSFHIKNKKGLNNHDHEKENLFANSVHTSGNADDRLDDPGNSFRGACI